MKGWKADTIFADSIVNITMEYTFYLDAFVREGNNYVNLRIEILPPEEETQGQAYFCLINAPKLNLVNKPIYGVDQEQAKELSIKLVRDLIGSDKIFDQNGIEIFPFQSDI